MSSPAPDPVKVVRQHAVTSALLGVPFVPVYRRGGAMESPADAAPDRGGEGGLQASPHPASAQAAAQQLIPPPRTDWHRVDAKRAANQAALDDIRKRYEADAPHKDFITAYTHIVFGEGDPCARLMFIGEAPGADEDRTGRPFVGRAGQLLARMIHAMGLTRHDVYITNVLKTRPPNNATPTIDEAQRCSPYLFDQIAVIRPEVIVTLGLPATRLVLGSDKSMSSLRGHWAEFRHPDRLHKAEVAVPVMPTFHPAFLLRSYTQENRNKVWSDLRQAMTRLGLEGRKN